jgi:hypothetical protein
MNSDPHFFLFRIAKLSDPQVVVELHTTVRAVHRVEVFQFETRGPVCRG